MLQNDRYINHTHASIIRGIIIFLLAYVLLVTTSFIKLEIKPIYFLSLYSFGIVFLLIGVFISSFSLFEYSGFSIDERVRAKIAKKRNHQ